MPNQKLDSIIGFRAPLEMKEQLVRIAKAKGLSLSDLLLKAIQIGVETVACDTSSTQVPQSDGEKPEAPVGIADYCTEALLNSLKEQAQERWPYVNFNLAFAELKDLLPRHLKEQKIKETKRFVREYIQKIVEKGLL